MQNSLKKQTFLSKRTKLLILMFITVLFSLPKYVKTDLIESISTLLLVLIIGAFFLAGIGWYTKRNEYR